MFYTCFYMSRSPSIRAVGEFLIYGQSSDGVFDPATDYFVGLGYKRLDFYAQRHAASELQDKLGVGSLNGLKIGPAFLFLQERNFMQQSAAAGDMEFVELHGAKLSKFAEEGGFELAAKLAIASARTVAQQACAKKPQCITNVEEKPKNLATFLPSAR